MNFVTTTPDNKKTVGSRAFVLYDDASYYAWDVSGKEIAFDVDVSSLPCGVKATMSLNNMDS